MVVGLEETIPEMRDLVLIAAPARRGAEHLGTVAAVLLVVLAILIVWGVPKILKRKR